MYFIHYLKWRTYQKKKPLLFRLGAIYYMSNYSSSQLYKVDKYHMKDKIMIR